MTRGGLFLILAAAVAAGAVGYLAGSADVETAPEPAALGTDAPPEPERSVESRLPMPEAPSGGYRSLSEALEAIPFEAAEGGGDGTITGTVKTQTGEPLADVLVRADRTPDRPVPSWQSSGEPPDEQELVEEVRELVEKRRLCLAQRREARTDPEGRYVIQGLADEDYNVTAYKKGWRIGAAQGSRAYKVKPGDEIDFTAAPLVGIPIVVLLPDGAEPEKAWITAAGAQYPRTLEWRPEKREIYFSPGSYTLSASAGDDREMRSEEVEVVLEEGVPVSEMTFRVKGRPGIKGEVVFKGKTAQPYVQVAAMKVPTGGQPDLERLSGATKQAWVFSGRREFTFTDLEPGTWVVGALSNQSKLLAHKTVEVGNGMAEVEIEVEPGDPGDLIHVRVEAPDGEIVPDARVSTGYISPTGGSMGGGWGATHQDDGTWMVTHPEKYPGMTVAEGGTYYVQAYSAKFGTKRVEYDRENTRSLTVRFDEPGSLIVTLSDYKGSLYEGFARLSLQPKVKGQGGGGMGPYFGGMGMGGRQGIDADGTQKFKPVAPGDYVLTVRMQGKRWSQQVVHEETVAVKTGENRVTVPLPPLHTVKVLVPDAEGATVSYSIEPRSLKPGSFFPAETDAEAGAVILRYLPPGEYVFNIAGGRVAQKMTIVVPGQDVVRFVPQVFNAMLVTVEDTGKYLASVGFQSGDLVIGVDGQEFEDETNMDACLLEAKKLESVKLDVLRGSKRMSITVDLAKARDPGQAGGRMSPSPR